MKRAIIITFLVITFGFSACAMFGTPTPGCEKSFTAQNHQVLDVILSASVAGLYAVAVCKPDIYAKAHQAAQVAIGVLSQDTAVPIGELGDIDGGSLLGILDVIGFFGAGQILDKCDRDYLVAYLQMI